MDDLKKLGRWIIAIYRHIESFRAGPERAHFGPTRIAAIFGLLIARMRRLETISWNRLVAMANDMGISEYELKSMYLPQLAKAELIEVIYDSNDSIQEVLEHASSSEETLTDVATLWLSIPPSDVERAVVMSVEICSLRPQSLTEYQEALGRQGFNEETIKLARQLQRSFKLLQEIRDSDFPEPFLYNEYLWGNRIKEAARYFNYLPDEVKDYVAELFR